MRSLAYILLGAVSACAPTGGPVTGGTGGATVRFDMSVVVPAHAEQHLCQFVQMPSSARELFIQGGSYTTTPGTHHFLLFRTAPIDPPPVLGVPRDCYEGGGLMQFERGFVTGGQLRAESAEFPPGAALAFRPGEILLLQSHFLNPGEANLESRVHVEMHPARADEVTVRVGTFRFYNPYIYVPARSRATARMRCHVHNEVTVISAGSHMHARGVAYRAYLDPSAGDRATAPFFTTDDWQHPPFWRGPLTAKAGSAIRFECDYDNKEDRTVTQGLQSTDEMCMFSAFYVPEQPDDENDCVSMDMQGSGGRTCAETNSCIAQCLPADAPRFVEGKADVGACWQKCIAESCPNVSEVLTPQLECTASRCVNECAHYDAACVSCIAQKCKAQLDACQALPCGP